MRQPGPQHGTEQLDHHIGHKEALGQFATRRHHQRNRRIEMGATDGAKYLDQDVQATHRCQCVGQQRNGHVAT